MYLGSCVVHGGHVVCVVMTLHFVTIDNNIRHILLGMYTRLTFFIAHLVEPHHRDHLADAPFEAPKHRAGFQRMPAPVHVPFVALGQPAGDVAEAAAQPAAPFLVVVAGARGVRVQLPRLAGVIEGMWMRDHGLREGLDN